MRLRSYRRPILVNDYEVAVDSQLGRLCERYAARLFAKVGMKDVLPIQGSGLDNEDYRYALMAHFDFVIAHQGGEAMLAVEFDGGRHRTDPQQIIRDDRKNRICDKFLLPLVRAGASSLQRADHRTLLEWLIELFFEQRRLWAQHEAYEEGGDVDPPDYDPREFNYREAWKPFDRGLETAGLLDAFGEARSAISKFYWRRPIGCPEFEGWYGDDPRGHTVGHLGLEVERERWLLSTGRCDLRWVDIWLDGVFPPALAQDIALLGLARQLEAWESGDAETLSGAEVTHLVGETKKGLLSWLNQPNQREKAESILTVLRGWGVNVDDPLARYDIYDGLQRDDESDDDYHDRMRGREAREELERELGITPLRYALRRGAQGDHRSSC